MRSRVSVLQSKGEVGEQTPAFLFRKTGGKTIIKKMVTVIFFPLALLSGAFAQTDVLTSQFTIARLKYSGGGDWYNDPSIIPNLLAYLRKAVHIDAAENELQVSLTDEDIFSYPFLFMTGHGRISFSEKEADRLRTYLTKGGFLFADDDYGMDEHFKREMKKVFPEKKLLEIPFSHEIYHSHFDFPNGLPKIHEHDGLPPKGYGYFHEGRLVVFYAFSSNISDGWADPEVHGDLEEIRESALRMGTNIVVYALMN